MRTTTRPVSAVCENASPWCCRRFSFMHTGHDASMNMHHRRLEQRGSQACSDVTSLVSSARRRVPLRLRLQLGCKRNRETHFAYRRHWRNTCRWMHRRAVARLAFFARLAIALACFQLSGYGHFVTDALASAGMIENHDDDCQDEDERGCPPGCPTCHCVHCVTPALPAPASSAAPTPPGSAYTSTIRRTAMPPVTPEPSHVYRPPRSISLHV